MQIRGQIAEIDFSCDKDSMENGPFDGIENTII